MIINKVKKILDNLVQKSKFSIPYEELNSLLEKFKDYPEELKISCHFAKGMLQDETTLHLSLMWEEFHLEVEDEEFWVDVSALNIKMQDGAFTYEHHLEFGSADFSSEDLFFEEFSKEEESAE